VLVLFCDSNSFQIVIGCQWYVVWVKNIVGLGIRVFKIFFVVENSRGSNGRSRGWVGSCGGGGIQKEYRCGQSSNASPVILRLTLSSILSEKFKSKCNSTVA
jgi:hypothetical protein